jgi:poly(A) polymerase
MQAHLDVVWLKKGPVARLLSLLDRDGEEARVVGGAVRNALLGEPITEFDVATTATPEEVTRRLHQAGCKAAPTGIDHGTVTAILDGHPIEVTTLREDVETFGRKANVVFGRDWQADAARRDFTINGLSVSRDGVVHDYVGGLADIAARRVRFIGDPAQRIAEDYLRILRFFRFHAAYGEGAPDRAALHACIMARRGLDALSRERVRMELMKLVVARHAVAVLALMTETGFLVRVLGGVPLLASFANMLKVEAAIGARGDAVRRLAALALWIADDAERLTERLRLSNAEHDRMQAMVRDWWRVTPAMGEGAARALLYRLGGERFLDRVLLAWTRSAQGAAEAPWHDLATLPLRFTPPAFPLAANVFMARGVPRGPKLGAALRAAEEAWIAAGFPTDAESLAAITAKAVAGVV